MALAAGVMAVALLASTSCRKPAETASPGPGDPIRGEPIVSTNAPAPGRSPPTNANAAAPMQYPELKPIPEVLEDGYLRVGFDRLSAFKFDIYEYYSEGQAGRPLLKSDDTIPPLIRAYDGRKVSIRGFVLPLRLKQGRALEFLLLRDQGTCCFGPQAQINHFMRVRYPAGAEVEQGRVHRVRGTLHVGETYVQGYLTGIYHLDAEGVDRTSD